jgi:hypothetical protein
MSVSTDSDFRWTLKGDVQTTAYRNLLGDHVKAGGTGDDQIGSEIIQKYIGALMLAEDFQRLTAHYRFNSMDLHNIISTAIAAGLEGEMPSPFIQDGLPRLLACVLVEKKAAITEIMQKVAEAELHQSEFAQDIHTDEEFIPLATQKKIDAILNATLEVGRKHYDYITGMNGPPDVAINQNGKGLISSKNPGGGCGCAAVLLLGGVIVSSGAAVCLSVIFSLQ